MRKDERAALATLLDSVGLGYTKHQAETKLLREFLKRTRKRERIIAAAELGDATPRVSVDLLVDARNRAFNAEQTAKKVQAELDALKAAHAWIKTSEQMPVSRESVLGIDGYGEVAQVSYSVPYLWTYDNSDRRPAGAVTHWMPLPEAPK